MADEKIDLLRQNKLTWVEHITIGRGPAYLLEEESDNLQENQNNKVAGWVQMDGGKYEAGIPGEPSEAIYDKSITKKNSAIKIGTYDDLETAKQVVEKNIPNKSEWVYF